MKWRIGNDLFVILTHNFLNSFRETIEMLRASSIPVSVIEMGDVAFSRGVALMRGAETLPANALLFFTDVDMLFTCDALKRIKSNTILNAQIYFPIVFSEFSHESWSENDKLLADAFHYGRGRGYFRHFGYGLAAMYKVSKFRIEMIYKPLNFRLISWISEGLTRKSKDGVKKMSICLRK